MEKFWFHIDDQWLFVKEEILKKKIKKKRVMSFTQDNTIVLKPSPSCDKLVIKRSNLNLSVPKK